MDVRSELFVTSMNLFKGSNHNSEVLDAVRAATSESRKAFEERFGPIRMESRIIAADYQGGWVETYALTEDGSVQHAFHEGGSEEAERIRREAREGASRSWFG